METAVNTRNTAQRTQPYVKKTVCNTSAACGAHLSHAIVHLTNSACAFRLSKHRGLVDYPFDGNLNTTPKRVRAASGRLRN